MICSILYISRDINTSYHSIYNNIRSSIYINYIFYKKTEKYATTTTTTTSLHMPFGSRRKHKMNKA